MVFDQKAAQYGWVDYFYLVRAKWPILALSFSLVMLIGVGVRWKTPRVYEASARIAIDLPERSAAVRSVSTRMQAVSLDRMNRLEAGIMDRNLLRETVESCGLVDRWGVEDKTAALALLKARVRLQPGEKGEYFDVFAKDLSEEAAAEIANSVGQTFVEHSGNEARSLAENRLEELKAEVNTRLDTIEQYEDRLQVLSKEPRAVGASEDEASELRHKLVSENYLLRSLEAKEQLATVELREASSGLWMMQIAGKEDAVVADSGRLALLYYGMAGMLLGCMIIGLTSRDNGRLTVLKRIQEGIGIKLVRLAPIPSIPLARLNRPSGPVIEAYRELRMRLHRLPAADSMLLTLLPSDSDAHVADVAANLAVVIADAGQTAIVIDADFRGARMHNLFDASNSVGLTDFLSGEMRMEETVVKARRPNVWLMPSGPVRAGHGGLNGSKRMDDLIWDMRSRFDYVILVAPSLEESADAGALIGYSDHTLMVSSYRGHSIQKLIQAKQSIESSGGKASGLILSQTLSYPKNSTDSGGSRQRSSRRAHRGLA